METRDDYRAEEKIDQGICFSLRSSRLFSANSAIESFCFATNRKALTAENAE
jgi:hypothetical protein